MLVIDGISPSGRIFHENMPSSITARWETYEESDGSHGTNKFDRICASKTFREFSQEQIRLRDLSPWSRESTW